MLSAHHDPDLAKLENEIRESRFKAWDVEEFLTRRHQAKIDALSENKGSSQRYWEAAKGLATLALTAIGYLTVVTILGLWLITGQFPLP